MKGLFSKQRLESGQVIPLVVIMMVAILGMVALVLDGGSLMSDRRTAQAAADAGAIAMRSPWRKVTLRVTAPLMRRLRWRGRRSPW